MSTITIKSCRNATEKLSFEWPDRLPDTTGEFVGLVTCDVINPRFPRIRADQISWAVDNAIRLTKNDGTDVEEVASLISLKDWLNYAQLEINAPDDEAALAKSKQIAKLEVQMNELKGMSLTLQGQVAERHEKLEALVSKPDTVIIPEREFESSRSRKIAALWHAGRNEKPGEIQPVTPKLSRLCRII